MDSGKSGTSAVDKYRAACKEAEQEYETEKAKLWQIYRGKLREAYENYAAERHIPD